MVNFLGTTIWLQIMIVCEHILYFCSYNHVDCNDLVLEELKLVKVKLNLVEVQITEKNLEIKLLFEKLACPWHNFQGRI